MAPQVGKVPRSSVQLPAVQFSGAAPLPFHLAAGRTRVAAHWDIQWLGSPLLFSAVVNGTSSWKTAKMVNAYWSPLCSCAVSDSAYDWLLFCTVFIWESVWAGSPRYKHLDGTSCWDFFLWKMTTRTGCWARGELDTDVACKGRAEEGCAHTFHVLPQVKQGTPSAITWLLRWLCVGCYGSFLVYHLNLAVPCIYLFFLALFILYYMPPLSL